MAMQRENGNNSELQTLKSKLTVLEKGRHDDPQSFEELKRCRDRIAEIEDEQKKV
jgi:hypothetical protein